MDLGKEKYKLIEQLVKTEDEGILDQVKAILDSSNKDWWNEISVEEKLAIEIGEQELNAGKGISHEAVMEKINKRFFNK